ncbi:Uncharacterized protein XB16_1125 [Leptospira santarosai]|uniref:Uncharacterized protein n=1 Tax=Leptospira santarosai TaxID=28183 RepID=A0A2P1QRU9_9LEPT|nr:Uncharacterized protein XB16_1125 [Leptospira santarosai]
MCLDVPPEIEDSEGNLPTIRLNSLGYFGELGIEKTGKGPSRFLCLRRLKVP